MTDDLVASMKDDYYDEGFENYEADTRDPGPWMLIGICMYSVFCVFFLSILVQSGRRRERKREERHVMNVKLEDGFDLELVEEKVDNSNEEIGSDEVLQNDILSHKREVARKQKRKKGKKYAPLGKVHVEVPCEIDTSPRSEGGKDSCGEFFVHTDERFVDNEGNKTKERSMWKKLISSKQVELFVDIAKYDRETDRIIKLGTPFTLAEVFEALFDALMILLISRYLHVHALSAYVVSNLLIGLSMTFMEGIGESLHTLCSHAIGADNHKLAGQYVQISTILYAAFSMPILGCWWFGLENCLALFGINTLSVAIGTNYGKVVMFHYFVEGVCDSSIALLDVSGHEMHTMMFGVIARLLSFILTWSLLATVDGFDLYWVGVTQLCTSVFFYALFLMIAVCLDWFKPFWLGMTKTFALKNKPAVLHVLRTAAPLSLGTLLEYGEWQLLTIFAATLGPAEVAAWGIMEAIWDLFEAATEGFSEAGSMRLALHLGKGNIKSSRRSSWKSLFLTTILAIVITTVLFICGEFVAGWFTEDETLQGMINSMLPLVGFGNIFMAFGSVSWALIGAQGRFKLATTISAIVSFLVTIPLAAIFCIVFKFNLEGLVASLVVGYSTTSLCMAYILLTSDWLSISDEIKRCNAIDDDANDDSDSENDDESCSSTTLEDGEDRDCSKLDGMPLAKVIPLMSLTSGSVIDLSVGENLHETSLNSSASTSSSSDSSTDFVIS